MRHALAAQFQTEKKVFIDKLLASLLVSLFLGSAKQAVCFDKKPQDRETMSRNQDTCCVCLDTPRLSFLTIEKTKEESLAMHTYKPTMFMTCVLLCNNQTRAYMYHLAATHTHTLTRDNYCLASYNSNPMILNYRTITHTT